jgi:hypothetical protein
MPFTDKKQGRALKHMRRERAPKGEKIFDDNEP